MIRHMVFAAAVLWPLQQSGLNLTSEEADWLSNHPVIRIAPDPEFPPIEWFDEENRYRGIAADFMELVSSQLGVELEIVRCRSWEEVLSKARNREVDMLPSAAQTPGRAGYMLFSDPYLVFPGVIITRSDQSTLDSSKKLYGKKVGIVSGYVWHEMIGTDHPQIDITAVENVLQGLRKVSTYEIDACIATLPVAIYYIEKEGIHNLIVSGETEYKTSLSVLTRNDWPLLNSIVKKALNALPQAQKRRIINKWITLQPVSFFRNKTVVIITLSLLAAVLLTVLIVSLWNAALRNQVRLKTEKLQTDIARRKTLETQLKSSEARYRRITENMTDVVFTVDMDLNTTYISPSVRNLVGFGPDEYLTKKAAERHPPETLQKFRAFMEEELAKDPSSGKDRSRIIEGEHFTAAGDTIRISMHVSFLRNEKGDPVGIQGVTRDITGLRQAEEDLLRLKDELQETVAERTAELQEKVAKLSRSEKAMLFMVEDLNKLTAELSEERRKLLISNQELEAFTYSVSHDLRAPLRAVDGFGKFLLEDYADALDEEGKRFLGIIRKNTARMDRLILDLLSLSRVSRAEMNTTLVDMSGTAELVFQEIAGEDEKKVFKVHISQMPSAVCDLSLITQVWQNLIGNALKYSERSSIKRIEIGASQTDREIIFCVRDRGAGFDDTYIDKLFGVFQRLHGDEEFEGTGVGLAIVKRIVERHSGRVWAEGTVGEGAAFYFSLPRK